MIKYIGSKRVLVPRIVEVIQQLGAEQKTVVDLFSGTSRVGHALKAAGYRVLSNDYNCYAKTLATCYVQADRGTVIGSAAKLIKDLERVPASPGYFTETFCIRSRYFQPKNGARIDAIREAIASKSLEPELEAVVLTSLMEAADRVDSTTGLQMAYLKQWAPRAFNDLELRVPDVLPRALAGKGRAYCLDAREAARKLKGDVAYLDPPYNQHSYLGNYHVWETLVRWDKPDVYGVACKRLDIKDRGSDFNSKRKFAAAFEDVISSVRAKHLIVSFNDEGYIDRTSMERLLGRRGHVAVVEFDYKRYVGAQIGIHNLRGEKVGKISHLRNKEFLYVVSPKQIRQRRSAAVQLNFVT